ncbi:MAG: site-specific DNA-methyltransferase [Ardenticatenales bacterium]|nr:site-specific DNA-methyltransferase [Ardenticatenales bacterium]MCB9172624.1 site-specific DNA-methyltransferase [Ardenticatenales bacterium]
MNGYATPLFSRADLVVSQHYDPSNRATIYLGDCLDLMSDMPEQSVQLAITSPPYNIGKAYEDVMDLEAYRDQQDQVIAACDRILRPTGSICWQVGNYVDGGEIVPLDIILYESFKRRGYKLRNRIIWHFGHGLHCKNRFSGRYETILWFTKSDDYYFDLDPVRVPQKYPGKRHFKGEKRGQLSGNPLGKNPSDVWDIPNVKANHIEKTDHPCQFPVSLVQRLVLSMSQPDDLVFDPFLGAGTTAVAALLNRRRIAGAELMEAYHKIAMDRVKKTLSGEIKVRADKPVYKPEPTSKLARNQWTGEELSAQQELGL